MYRSVNAGFTVELNPICMRKKKNAKNDIKKFIKRYEIDWKDMKFVENTWQIGILWVYLIECEKGKRCIHIHPITKVMGKCQI